MNIFKGSSSSADDTARLKSVEFRQHYNLGRDLLMRAVEIDEKFSKDNTKDHRAKLLEACELYKKGIDEFRKAERINMMEILPEQRSYMADCRKRIDQYLNSAEDRFMTLFKKFGDQTPGMAARKLNTPQNLSPSSSTARTASPGKRVGRNVAAASVPAKPPRSSLLRGVDAKLGELILNEMLVNTYVRLTDVCGCESAKSALEEAVVLPALNPDIFTGLRQPVKGILLYGPPGNGKTMLAKAVANESGQTFFNISASTLTSKWVGDAEKTIRTLFQIARNAQPSIVFIDEIDSILRDRSEKDSDVSRRMKTEFLVQFDGATACETDKILVIGATNRPQELDEAVLRRFPKRILLSLPDDAGRYVLIKSILIKHGMFRGLQDSDIKYIASRTSGYSHADLVALCKEAAMVPVRSIDKSKLPTTGTDKIRNLKASDFDKALTVIKPSSSSKHMDELYEFSRKTGG